MIDASFALPPPSHCLLCSCLRRVPLVFSLPLALLVAVDGLLYVFLVPRRLVDPHPEVSDALRDVHVVLPSRLGPPPLVEAYGALCVSLVPHQDLQLPLQDAAGASTHDSFVCLACFPILEPQGGRGVVLLLAHAAPYSPHRHLLSPVLTLGAALSLLLVVLLS